ncbi:unnamed protein product [Camellia sinensis]
MDYIIGSVGDDEALLGVALVEPRRGGTWEGSSCWAVTLQDIGVYHRDAVYQTKSPRHAHMRFSGTCSCHRPPPSPNRLLSSPPTRTNRHPLSPFPFSVAAIVCHRHRTIFCLPHLQGPAAIPSLPFLSLPSVREQHNAGYKHKANARTYYQQFEAQQNQSLIHQKITEHLGQTTAYQQVGAAYNALRPRVPILPTPMMPMAGNTQLPVNSPLIPGARPPVLPRPLPGWHVRVLPCSWCGFTLQVSGLGQFGQFGLTRVPNTKLGLGLGSNARSGRKEEILKCGKGSNDLERIERGANELYVCTSDATNGGATCCCCCFAWSNYQPPKPPPMGAPSAVPGTTMTPASVSTSMVTPAMYQAANSAPPTSGGFDSFNMSAQAPEADH